MNLEQRSESAHRLPSSGQRDDLFRHQVAQPASTSAAAEDTIPCFNPQHNAPDPATTMSDRGLDEITTTVVSTTGNDDAQAGSPRGGCIESHAPATDLARDESTQAPDQGVVNIAIQPQVKAPPIYFEDLAENLRIQRHLDNRQRTLQKKRRVLQKTIVLSARLHRISFWIRDGLVEISKHADPGAFVRVHQHTEDLVDLAYSQWNNELHSQESLGNGDLRFDASNSFDAFLPKLTSSAQSDLMALISQLRNNSKFLVERLRTLSHPQIVALSTFPRFEDVSESVLTSLQGRNRVSQQRSKRIILFSKGLEEYATSFERSNPLSLLLYNIYGTDHSLAGKENKLRMSTWSSVCAELLQTCDEAYQAILPQVLSAFASLHDWRVKDAIELVLMDILQRGAFLLDLVSEYEKSSAGSYDPFSTDQAQDFFLHAVLDLLRTLVRADGGFPLGAFQFACAMLGKLSSEQHQHQFRGDYLRWYLERHLRIVISYPENENMLLKFHISKEARNYILFPLWSKIDAMFADALSASPSLDIPDEFHDHIATMVYSLECAPAEDPYREINSLSTDTMLSSFTIAICPSEIVQVLEALTPQAMHGAGRSEYGSIVLTSHNSTFHAERDQFGRLRRELLLVIEPGSSASEVHPSREQWLHLCIDQTGQLAQLQPFPDHNNGILLGIEDRLDLAQQAALRMGSEMTLTSTSSSTNYRTGFSFSWSLENAFSHMVRSTKASSNPMASLYWEHAQTALYKNYPLTRFTQDDSSVLRILVAASQKMQVAKSRECTLLEADLSKLEDMVHRIRSTVTQFVERFEDLRLKLWYSIDVLSSKFYEDAKDITAALNNMALSILRTNSGQKLTSPRRPSSRRSTTSSLWKHTLEDATSMLKAPSEHGGPKKLADTQIENTKKWLQRSNVDNFCRGEERIHRFCMEVATLSRKLVGESIVDGPVLWSSKLFSREQTYYDNHTPSVFSAPASTRPASVMSETFSTSLRVSRPVYRSNESTRMTLFGDEKSPPRRPTYGMMGGRIARDILPPDLASSIGSPQPSFSATTAESISNFWSPPPSNTRSMTSASVYSRPASTYNDTGPSNFTGTVREKTKFLDRTHKTLVCLLLSDLGCPVWSLGSETDAWLDTVRNASYVDQRLRHRRITENLLDQSPVVEVALPPHQVRTGRSASASASPLCRSNSYSRFATALDPTTEEPGHMLLVDSTEGKHFVCLELLLVKLSQQVDPLEKLAIVEDFYNVSIAYMQEGGADLPRDTDAKRIAHTVPEGRRKSVDSYETSSRLRQARVQSIEPKSWTASPSEPQIVQHIKLCLTRLRPKTLFRDLQYIAAFVPSEMTDKTAQGEAFLRLGLAALSYKDEICRTMVDISDVSLIPDGMDVTTSTKSTQLTSGQTVEYLMLAAKEGNASAQRQIAILYLSHPHLLSIITRPLSLSSEIFRDDMRWQEPGGVDESSQTLCLALHWMQQAADGGDEVARRKIDERKAQPSIH